MTSRLLSLRSIENLQILQFHLLPDLHCIVMTPDEVQQQIVEAAALLTPLNRVCINDKTYCLIPSPTGPVWALASVLIEEAGAVRLMKKAPAFGSTFTFRWESCDSATFRRLISEELELEPHWIETATDDNFIQCRLRKDAIAFGPTFRVPTSDVESLIPPITGDELPRTDAFAFPTLLNSVPAFELLASFLHLNGTIPLLHAAPEWHLTPSDPRFEALGQSTLADQSTSSAVNAPTAARHASDAQVENTAVPGTQPFTILADPMSTAESAGSLGKERMELSRSEFDSTSAVPTRPSIVDALPASQAGESWHRPLLRPQPDYQDNAASPLRDRGDTASGAYSPDHSTSMPDNLSAAYAPQYSSIQPDCEAKRELPTKSVDRDHPFPISAPTHSSQSRPLPLPVMPILPHNTSATPSGQPDSVFGGEDTRQLPSPARSSVGSGHDIGLGAPPLSAIHVVLPVDLARPVNIPPPEPIVESATTFEPLAPFSDVSFASTVRIPTAKFTSDDTRTFSDVSFASTVHIPTAKFTSDDTRTHESPIPPRLISVEPLAAARLAAAPLPSEPSADPHRSRPIPLIQAFDVLPIDSPAPTIARGIERSRVMAPGHSSSSLETIAVANAFAPPVVVKPALLEPAQYTDFPVLGEAEHIAHFGRLDEQAAPANPSRLLMNLQHRQIQQPSPVSDDSSNQESASAIVSANLLEQTLIEAPTRTARPGVTTLPKNSHSVTPADDSQPLSPRLDRPHDPLPKESYPSGVRIDTIVSERDPRAYREHNTTRDGFNFNLDTDRKAANPGFSILLPSHKREDAGIRGQDKARMHRYTWIKAATTLATRVGPSIGVAIPNFNSSTFHGTNGPAEPMSDAAVEGVTAEKPGVQIVRPKTTAPVRLAADRPIQIREAQRIADIDVHYPSSNKYTPHIPPTAPLSAIPSALYRWRLL